MWICPVNAQAQGDRQEQQDSFAFSDHQDTVFLERAGFLAILADGMGGMARGREASDLAVQTLLEAYAVKKKQETVPLALQRAFRRANMAVWEMGREGGCEDSVGTTAVVAVVQEGKLFWANAGDSRLYLWREGNLRQITRDHNLRERLLEQGVPEEVAVAVPQADALTSYLGGREIPILDVPAKPLPLQEGDRILLCSDGLYRGLNLEEMSRILAGPFDRSAQSLLEEVLARHYPHQDNVTVLVLAVEKKGPPSREILFSGGRLPGALKPGEFFKNLTWLWKKN